MAQFGVTIPQCRLDHRHPPDPSGHIGFTPRISETEIHGPGHSGPARESAARGIPTLQPVTRQFMKETHPWGCVSHLSAISSSLLLLQAIDDLQNRDGILRSLCFILLQDGFQFIQEFRISLGPFIDYVSEIVERRIAKHFQAKFSEFLEAVLLEHGWLP